MDRYGLMRPSSQYPPALYAKLTHASILAQIMMRDDQCQEESWVETGTCCFDISRRMSHSRDRQRDINRNMLAVLLGAMPEILSHQSHHAQHCL